MMYFHFITGVPPFASDVSDEQVKFNILERNIHWDMLPADTPASCRDAIDQFLIKDPTLRLGQKGGKEVKRHHHFATIDFENLLNKPGPLIPEVQE